MMLINVKRLTDPAYRRELIDTFLAKAAHTQPDALPYPQDWSEPAASPPAFQTLAEATQAALLRRDELIAQRAPIEERATLIEDWDTAQIGHKTYWSRNDAENRPSQVIDANWLGYAVPWGPDLYGLQLVWPFGAGGSGVTPTMMFIRARDPYGWGNWARFQNFVHSYGLLDGMVDYRHADVTRFKAGHKYGGSGGAPDPADTWRVQCADLSGQFTHTALSINQAGTVSFPKGHARAAAARADGDPVPADQAATHGDVAAMLIIALRAYAAGHDPEPLIRALIAGEDK